MPDPDRPLARASAALVAAAGAVALIGQYTVTRATQGVTGAPDALWRMAGYFTVLVNVLLVLHFARCATGRQGYGNPGTVTAGLVLSIIVVGLVYHTLLSGLWSLSGLAWWADQGLHSAMPLLSALWWVVFAPKTGLTLRDLAIWILLPLAYCIYAIARGVATGFWAYPFLDPGLHGTAGVVVNLIGMMIGFLVLGLAMLTLARWSGR